MAKNTGITENAISIIPRLYIAFVNAFGLSVLIISLCTALRK
jgi:hypothetical protein